MNLAARSAHAGWLVPPALVAVAIAFAFGLPGADATIGAQRLLVLLVLSPLIEETLFRVGLQDLLQRRIGRSAPAIVLTAIAFGVAHALWRGQWLALLTALPALPIGALFARTGRLWPCVALHAVLNAAWLAIGVWLGTPAWR